LIIWIRQIKNAFIDALRPYGLTLGHENMIPIDYGRDGGL